MINLAEQIALTYLSGNKVLVCGNGGLAAEAEHFTAELMGKFGQDIYIPCFALTVPSALITALANDLGYSDVFSHQVKTMGKPGDLLIAMTTSQSPNIIKAMVAGKDKDMNVIIICSTWSAIIWGENVIRIAGAEVGEVQENIIRYLHKVAREAKEIISNV